MSIKSTRPLVLVTNRFDPMVLLKAQQSPKIEYQFIKDLYENSSLLEKAEGLILRSYTKLDSRLISKMPKLKFVVSCTAGFDHLDLKLAIDKGIRCCHTPGAQSLAAAEMTMLLLLCALRKYPLALDQIRRGDWQREALSGRQMQGLHMGIIGLGRVGCEIKKLFYHGIQLLRL